MGINDMIEKSHVRRKGGIHALIDVRKRAILEKIHYLLC